MSYMRILRANWYDGARKGGLHKRLCVQSDTDNKCGVFVGWEGEKSFGALAMAVIVRAEKSVEANLIWMERFRAQYLHMATMQRTRVRVYIC